ncbi:alpha/beta fold hydrolase [Prescottella agglutinans]|uniref:Pimeloyl-ACP methyl ester carboxylesterase n=1 Tax=Prescottella agglutinans TaxID=1644129 RepID=A0ABT6M3P9_9NOCA|nr:alpha/beta hydrolase [Prescottella agglutinans]MDH6278918.1 pimeloyl-ACP methyl ester carboxylesterase [Prescottella agglutinans]
MGMRRIRTLTAMCVLALAAVLSVGVSPAAAKPKPTVVLVHGAFADTTSWISVAAELRGRGYDVVVPSNPLRGPGYDSAAIEKVLADIPGPVLLVGHSYGGVVITNTHSPNVAGLVYVAAFAPDQGEPAMAALNPLTFPGSQLVPPALQTKVVDDPTNPIGKNLDAYIDPGHFHEVFCQDVSAAMAADMNAHQRSLAVVANLEPTQNPSWKTLPSWAVIPGADRAIPPASERFMAQRAGARITDVPGASHAVLVSRPGDVAGVIDRAASEL